MFKFILKNISYNYVTKINFKEKSMNFYDKFKKFCRPFRIIIGLILISIAVITSNPWFYVGILPLLVGVTNFCPLCVITKKCSI